MKSSGADGASPGNHAVVNWKRCIHSTVDQQRIVDDSVRERRARSSASVRTRPFITHKFKTIMNSSAETFWSGHSSSIILILLNHPAES